MVGGKSPKEFLIRILLISTVLFYGNYSNLSRKEPLLFADYNMMTEVLELPCSITERAANFYSLQQDGLGIVNILIYNGKTRYFLQIKTRWSKYWNHPDLSGKDPLLFTDYIYNRMADVLELSWSITERPAYFYSLRFDGWSIGIILLYHGKIL